MNGQEQSTLNELNRKFDDLNKNFDTHIKDVTPMVKAYHDQRVIDKFIGKVWRGVVAILGLLALIGGIWVFFKD